MKGKLPLIAESSGKHKKPKEPDIRRKGESSPSPSLQSLLGPEAKRDTRTPRWSGLDAAHEVRQRDTVMSSDFCDHLPSNVKITPPTRHFGIEELGRNVVVPAQVVHWRRSETLQLGKVP